MVDILVELPTQYFQDKGLPLLQYFLIIPLKLSYDILLYFQLFPTIWKMVQIPALHNGARLKEKMAFIAPDQYTVHLNARMLLLTSCKPDKHHRLPFQTLRPTLCLLPFPLSCHTPQHCHRAHSCPISLAPSSIQS